jgi:hypothetical protein
VRGWTTSEDADAYVDYLMETGMREYRTVGGNRAASSFGGSRGPD